MPESYFRIFWDSIILFMVILSMFYTPFAQSLKIQELDNYYLLEILNICL